MNTAVSFELAKLLKDKGFGEGALNFYTNPRCKMFGKDERGRHYPIKNKAKRLWVSGEHFVLDSKHVYCAPTIAEVVMWLYEKHSLWILPLPTVCGYFAWKIIDMQDNPNRPIERPPYNDVDGVDYRTPTEAYEAAISHALTNIVK